MAGAAGRGGELSAKTTEQFIENCSELCMGL
jgi:hypothetical protein